MKKYCLVTILLSVLMSMPLSAYDFEKNGIYYVDFVADFGCKGTANK